MESPPSNTVEETAKSPAQPSPSPSSSGSAIADASDDTPGVPDTVDPPVQDSKLIHPLLRSRARDFTLKEICEILASNTMKSLPRHFMPTDSRRRMQPPHMFYGWELDEEKLLAFAEKIGLKRFSTCCYQRDQLKDRNIDPANVTDCSDRFPGMVRVREFNVFRTMSALFALYLDELDIDTCLVSPIRTVFTADGLTTQIYAFYSNYHCGDAPRKAELEDLHWVMDEFDMSREMKWWFSAEDPHWRHPLDPDPHR
ncbi:hypothetical protein EIP86_006232 [Pleurotus ostreatoroseus]|nr:hypothetical protein EIP86_006232 [Pleurotus ostreatoroseus]